MPVANMDAVHVSFYPRKPGPYPTRHLAGNAEVITWSRSLSLENTAGAAA